MEEKKAEEVKRAPPQLMLCVQQGLKNCFG